MGFLPRLNIVLTPLFNSNGIFEPYWILEPVLVINDPQALCKPIAQLGNKVNPPEGKKITALVFVVKTKIAKAL